MAAKYYRIRGPNGKYYDGNVREGVALFDVSFDDAMIMDEDEVLIDFPNHLPVGAVLVQDV